MCIEAWRDGIVVWYWYTNVSYLRHLPPPVTQHPGPRFASTALLHVGPRVWVHGWVGRVDVLARPRPTAARVG
jgi:hypothetical protein